MSSYKFIQLKSMQLSVFFLFSYHVFLFPRHTLEIFSHSATHLEYKLTSRMERSMRISKGKVFLHFSNATGTSNSVRKKKRSSPGYGFHSLRFILDRKDQNL